MSQERLDCRGLACPNPVLKTKEIIDRGGVQRLLVVVDNPAAAENVSRFLGRFGYDTTVDSHDGIFDVTGTREESTECGIFVEEARQASEHKILIMVATDRMGRGDDELGRRLIVNFISTIHEMGQELWRLVLVNAGVKLAVEGSEVLDALKKLEESGVQLLVCGTCLNHFGLLEKKRVGETTNMLDIVTAMQLADKIINIT